MNEDPLKNFEIHQDRKLALLEQWQALNSDNDPYFGRKLAWCLEVVVNGPVNPYHDLQRALRRLELATSFECPEDCLFFLEEIGCRGATLPEGTDYQELREVAQLLKHNTGLIRSTLDALVVD